MSYPTQKATVSDLYPRGGVVDEALYLITDRRGRSEIAALVRAEDTVTVVTPTRVLPNTDEDRLQEVEVQKRRYDTDAIGLLRRAYRSGISPLQDAVCDIRNDLNKYVR